MIGLLTCTMVVSMAACGSSSATEPGSTVAEATRSTAETGGNGEGMSITVMVESGSPAESLANETKDKFKEETGITVNVDAIAYSGMYDKLSTEVQAGQIAHDVACMDFVWLPSFADAITPITGADTSDFLPSLEESGTYHDQLLGYPTWVNAKILIYRKDIFKSLGLEVPKTQEEYLKTAEYLSENTEYKGNALIGAGSDAVCTFSDFACQNGAKSLILDANGKCNLTSEPFVNALKYMVDLDKYGMGDSTATQSTEAETYFEDGKNIMELNWSHQYPKAVAALGADKVGCVANLSGSAGTGATGGPWYECVMKGSTHQKEAMEYTKWMWDHNADYMTTKSSLQIAASRKVYEDYGKKPRYEHLNAVLETLNGNALPRPLTQYWPQVENTLSSAIESAIEGNATPEEALKSAAEEVDAITGN